MLVLFLDGLAGLAGGLLSERWLKEHRAALVGFAAGALLAAAFLDVIPEAFQSVGPSALSWAFGGFVATAVFEWQFGHHHEHETELGAPPASLPVSLLGSDALHNVGDGAAVAAAFLTSTHAGLAVALAIISHEVPQEVGDFALLRGAGWSRRRALLGLAGVQLTAVIGGLAVLLASTSFRFAIPAVLSFTGGTFLYIGATDLLPTLHTGRTFRGRRERMLGFVAGIAVVFLASLL